MNLDIEAKTIQKILEVATDVVETCSPFEMVMMGIAGAQLAVIWEIKEQLVKIRENTEPLR